MTKRDDIIEDDSVEMTPESLRLAEEAEAKEAAEKLKKDDVIDEDDDFDLLGEEDDGDPDQGDSEDDEDESGEESDGAPRAPKSAPKDEKPKTKAQLRIEELAAARRTAEADALKIEMENIELKRRLEALEERVNSPQQASSTPTLKAPDPKDFAYGEVDEAYIDAKVEYKLAGEREKFKKDQLEKMSETDRARKIEDMKTKHAAATAEGAKKYGEKYKVVDQVTWLPEVALAVLESENTVDISYYLANNIDKLRELSRMGADQRTRALGRLEERFSASASTGRKRTAAPDMPGSKKKTVRKPDYDKYGPDDQDEFDKALWGR